MEDLRKAAGILQGRTCLIGNGLVVDPAVLIEEIDYLAEGRNAETFAAHFANRPDVRIPRVHWPLTTRRVLTLEDVEGIKITDYEAIEAAGIDCQVVNKVMEGRPHIVDMIKNGQIDLIVNTTEGKQAIADSYTIRRTALHHKVSYSTTLAGARATCMALEFLDTGIVNSLQALHREQTA